MINKTILSPKTFLTYSLGCRTNQAEMESISLQLMKYGIRQLDSLQHTAFSLQQKTPDIILLNTCVVTNKAERETRKEIRKLRKLYPKSFFIVLGCAVNFQTKFKINIPPANLYISNSQKNDIKNIINFLPFHSKNRSKLTHDRERNWNEFILNKYQTSGRKFIKIQEGCNCYCSFCLTSLLRGKPTSVPPNQIIDEINYWVNRGVKEIILTGINIGLYGNNTRHSERSRLPRKHNLQGGIPFFRSAEERDPSTPLRLRSGSVGMTITQLVQKILKETQIERISFSSIYPEMLYSTRSHLVRGETSKGSEFLDLVIKNPRITRSFHLSLQSGSPTVLKRMGRKTDLSRLKSRCKQIRTKIPEFTLRADLIAGFPGETEEEFRQTLELIKTLKISFAHVFPFSKRVGTPAYNMVDLPQKTKTERVKKIMEEVKNVRNDEAKKMIGLKSNCLIVRKVNGKWEGLTENNWPILITSHLSPIINIKGKIVPVKITKFKNDQLFGKI